MKGDGKKEEEETEHGRGCQGVGTAPKVNSTLQEKNVVGVVAKPEGGRGMESSTTHKPTGRHDHGGLNRQSRQVSKHIIREEGNAEVRIGFSV